MLLLMLLGVGSTPPFVAVRAYAALSFALNDNSAIGFSLVDNAGISITPLDNAEGSVS